MDKAPNAVAQIQADALDVYPYMVENADTFAKVKSNPKMSYTMSYGSFDSILFNCNKANKEFNDGRLNPSPPRRSARS